MEFNSAVKNIIFDFGGVLFEIDYNLPVEAFRNLGNPDFAKFYTQSNQNEIFDRLETGKISNGEFLQYLNSLVPNANPEQVLEAWNCILLRIWPQQVDVVKSLRTKGYRTFMLSNTNAIHVSEFERMIDETMTLKSFREAFEKIYYSNELGIKKPYPSTYLEVCVMNGIDPNETLFIDDSIQHVRGAAEAGLFAYHLEPGQKLDQVMQSFLNEGLINV